MPRDTASLVAELNALLRLTGTEQAVTGARQALARAATVRKELGDNAAKAQERIGLLEGAVRDLGGVPDRVGVGLGRLVTFFRLQAEQVTTFRSALLGDLALEHRLLDRTRFARQLAERTGHSSVFPVLDRLEGAHQATIAWIEERLAEVANGEEPALRPSPTQRVVGEVQRALTVPAGGLNKLLAAVRRPASSAAERLQETTRDAVGQAEGAARKATERTQSVLGQAQEQVEDKVGQAQEQVAPAKVVDLTEHELPIKSYDRLSGDDIMRHFADMNEPREIEQVLAYEREHKDRKGVSQAARARLEELGVSTDS